ncbi:hypothetical protein AAHE18_14G133800 [Arachis hypogaea]
MEPGKAETEQRRGRGGGGLQPRQHGRPRAASEREDDTGLEDTGDTSQQLDSLETKRIKACTCSLLQPRKNERVWCEKVREEEEKGARRCGLWSAAKTDGDGGSRWWLAELGFGGFASEMERGEEGCGSLMVEARVIRGGKGHRVVQRGRSCCSVQ